MEFIVHYLRIQLTSRHDVGRSVENVCQTVETDVIHSDPPTKLSKTLSPYQEVIEMFMGNSSHEISQSTIISIISQYVNHVILQSLVDTSVSAVVDGCQHQPNLVPTVLPIRGKRESFIDNINPTCSPRRFPYVGHSSRSVVISNPS
jgi:hypothetical protein